MTARRWRAFCRTVAHSNGPYRAVQNHVAKERDMTSRLFQGLAAAAALVVLTAAPAAAQSFTLTANLSGAGEGHQHRERRQHGRVRRLQSRRGHGSPDGELCRQRLQSAQRRDGEPHPRRRREDRRAGRRQLRRARRAASNDFGFSGTVAFSAFVLRPDQGIRSPDDMVQAILGGNSYCNVHSAGEPGRGNPRSARASEVATRSHRQEDTEIASSRRSSCSLCLRGFVRDAIRAD